ncbi:MAG: apolipoprotein N-acyltransferase [Pirellulales bacterium]|nr:apolipoprotein N-acyltransferase [Pirellulales bacterium]
MRQTPTISVRGRRSHLAKTSSPNDEELAAAMLRLVRYQRTWVLAFASAVLLWLSFPPVDLWPLAWIAPLGWLLLIRQPTLSGRRPYGLLWLAGFAFWIAMLQWLRLPHLGTAIGGVFLSAYLACYTSLFVGISRVALHRLHLPLWLAAPVVWTGLELARGHLLTGFTLASLAHTQYRWLAAIQVADLAGAYGVGFVVLCGAASLAAALPWSGERFRPRRLVPGVLLLAATLGYGQWRLSEEHTRPGPRVALIQGSIDIKVKADPGMKEVVFREYIELSRLALRSADDIDVVIWPETMFREPLITYRDDAAPAPGQEWERADLEAAHRLSLNNLIDSAQGLNSALLLGLDRHDYGNQRVWQYNSAVLVDRAGELRHQYDKMHPVMFGEYIPFGEIFPFVYRLSPLSVGLSAGAGPAAFEVDGARLAPSICFENMLPHLIRQQVLTLAEQNQEPDVLVNLTNDGWFYGSSELDLHLANGLFRSVELRKPMLIAANTGFSAWIDAEGRIVEQGPRRATGFIVADVELDDRHSPYQSYGDLPAWACLLATLAFGAVGLWDWRRSVCSLPGEPKG